MKKTRKLISLLVTLAMVFAMAIPAFAVDTNSYTISINNETDGYVYTAYQIFAGDLYVKDEDTILSNIVFGSALSETDQVSLLTEYADVLSAGGYESSAAGLAEALANGDFGAAEFAEKVANYSLTVASYSGNTSPYSISVTGAGYYLVKNTVVPDENGVYTNYILEVVKNVTVTPKAASEPYFEKTTDEEAAADYAVGSNVPFTLTATMPVTYFTDYDTYALTFHDTLSKGLSYNEGSVVVYVDGQVITSGFTVSTSNDDGCNLEVIFTNVKSTEVGAGAGSVIKVEYTATLLDEASYTEENKAYVSFSNDPNSSGVGKTTPDIVYIYTFELVINKVDENGAALSGAGFTLYKESNGEYELVSDEITDVTTFKWSGLSSGKYKLEETTTPYGYNTMEPIEFEIVAEYNEDGSIKSLVVKIDGTASDVFDCYTTTTTLTETDDDGNVISSTTVNGGVITSDIVNESGSELPSTGGMGTTLFYIFGGAMVLCAVVLLVTRRRMDNEQ